MNASDVRDQWASRTGEFSPRYYAYYGPDDLSEALLSALEERVGRDASMLELGCSSGRHLEHLREHGYDTVAGVEINEEALEVMAETYPALAAQGTFFADSIESVVDSLDDRAYDVVYSVQTLQHIHPEVEWVYDAIRRITDRYLLTVEIEGKQTRGDREMAVKEVDGMPLTYRNWRSVFEEGTFTQVHRKRIDNSTLRVFERVDR